jgi:hypothetical protein
VTPTSTPSTRRFAAAALCAGALAALALPGNRVGLGMLLVAALMLAAVALSGVLPRSEYSDVSLVLAAALAAMSIVRDTPWLVWLDLVAAIGVTVAAVVDARTWPAMAAALKTWARKLVPAPLAVAWFSGVRPGPRARRHAVPVARGLALGLALVLAFGALFASADQAFAQLTDGVLTPEVDLGLLPARVFAGIAAVAISGAVVLAAATPIAITTRRKTAARGTPEWLIALGLVNALFVLFLAVQVRVLFGGSDHVLHTAGLTYAQYARQGFYQLLVVAFLVLALVAVAGRHRGERVGRRPTPVELMLGLLCALTLVVLVSALRRLGLLEDTYGFTLTRLFGHAGTLWVGTVLLLVIAAGAARRTDLLPRTIVAASAAGLLAFSLLNPEGLVVSKNVQRYERTGKIDTRYLSTLGADATPALVRLPPVVVRRDVGPVEPSADGFFGWNLARARARDALRP